VLLCHRLLQSQPELLAMWQDIYRYLLIDEFQDINRMQYEVVKLLAKPRNNLFVVGDDDQSIYGFRGSDPSIMLGFAKEYPDGETVLLKENYRCTKHIVRSAVRLIDHNKNRFLKQLQAKKEGYQDVILTSCDSKEAEAEEIITLIKHYRQYGVYRDIAVLFRTNLSASFLAQKLSQERIPFWQKEKTKNLFDDPMALDLLAMLHFAHGEQKRKYFLRFMNKPVRYLRRDMVAENVDIDRMLALPGLGKNRGMLLKRLKYDLLQIRGMEPYAAINYIRKGMGYDQWVVENARERHQNGADHMELLDWIQNSARRMESFPAWLDMIEVYHQNLERSEPPSEEEDAVSLVTMHGSKGLEYKIIILPDINEGNVPQKKAATPKELEEERRVFYVAMTRAKEKLFLFYVKKTKENRLMPSRFLKEIGMRV
ncbi:MAG: ATP-dependent helicase, partial [Lachnospiraceae bacterium]|nr:ATP-dependent helicase [Lachnospiraceae bacterium]